VQIVSFNNLAEFNRLRLRNYEFPKGSMDSDGLFPYAPRVSDPIELK